MAAEPENRQLGFALIEVVIAVALISLVMVVALQSFSSTAMIETRSKHTEAVLRDASDLIVSLDRIPLVIGQDLHGRTINGDAWTIRSRPLANDLVGLAVNIEGSNGAKTSVSTVRFRSELNVAAE